MGERETQALKLVNSYGTLPLSFEENRGQIDAKAKFFSRGSGYTLFLTATEAVMALSSKMPKLRAPLTHEDSMAETVMPQRSTVLRMKLIGANPAPQITAVNELPGKSHYFIGNDPAKWRTNVATYARVKYREVYPGIDLVYYGNQRQLEYDWVVSPGAKPAAIRFAVEGAEGMKVDSNGDLILVVPGGEARMQKPMVYQETDGVRQEIAGGYVPKRNREIGFRIADYDSTRPLVIDPVLLYSTYLGGSGNDYGSSIAVDSAGNTYTTGSTGSTNFPTAGAGFLAGSTDAFVTKLNPSGTALVYSAYLGGSGTEFGSGIAVDSAGAAYVTGSTGSSDFPVANPLQASSAGIFVTKFNPSGSVLVYSTYLGGGSDDAGRAIAVDSSGSAYVTGSTSSRNFPTVNPFQSRLREGIKEHLVDAFVTKFNSSGTALAYSTYLGGTRQDYAFAVAVDSSNNAYVTGTTNSPDFPTANARQPARASGFFDAFVTKFSPSGSALIYSTYHGGADSPNAGHGIAVDSSGSAYVTGSTSSADFPVVNARQPTLVSSGVLGFLSDAFVTKFSPSGAALVYSTFHGGNDHDSGRGIAVDSSGNAYVTGFTYSSNFPTANARRSVLDGPSDAFVTKFDSSGIVLVYSIYLGGSDSDGGAAIAVDSSGNAYVTGQTQSGNFPTVNPVQPDYGGVGDAFVAKISPFTLDLFPQMTVGGGFSTIFTIANNGATTATGNLMLTDQEGSPWTVNGVLSDATTNPQSAPNGGQIHITGSSFPISIPPGGTSFLSASTLNPGDPTKSGWAELETTGGSLTAVATFQFVSSGKVESTAGVLASQPMQYATIPVDNNDSENRFTGYAIANPGPQSVSIKLASVDQSGNLVDDSLVITLGSGQQIARFLHQDVPPRLKFKGSIVLRGQSGGTFVVVALVQNQGRLTVIPVNPEKAPHIPN